MEEKEREGIGIFCFAGMDGQCSGWGLMMRGSGLQGEFSAGCRRLG